MLLNLMWVSLVDPWLWQIIAHIFRNLPGGPTMWLYEDHIACMKKIIQVSTSTYFNFWCKLICTKYILTVRRIDVRNSYSYVMQSSKSNDIFRYSEISFYIHRLVHHSYDSG